MVKQTPIKTTMQTIMHKQINRSQCLKTHIWFITLFLFFLLQSSTIFAGVTATTGRTVLSIDESIQLVIKSDSSSDDPDLSILENDFQILGKSQSQNYSYINGNASRSHTWNITLLPKKTGEITIPAIKVGNEATQPIHLVIQKQSNSPGIDGKDVYLKINLSDKSVADNKGSKVLNETYYVQQQIIITVQLFHRIRFSNATLSELEIENTVVEKLGNDANYSKTIANNRYNVIERRYAIYPQQSGFLSIPALTFSGNAEISQSFSLFSRPGRQIISRTKPITLDILAIPDSYTGKNWLPAESLEIESEILEDTSSIVAGEAITRHIIVRAKGLLGSQLPATSMSSSKSIKTYPDKEKLTNQLVDGKVLGIRRDTIAIIPLKPGSFTLPEIKIDWWNTKTNQQQSSTISSRTLSAAQPDGEPIASAENNKQTDQVSDQVQTTTDTATQQVVKTIEKIIYKNPELTKNTWFWVSLGLLILWLMTLALLIITFANTKQAEKNHSAADKSHLHEAESEALLQQIYQACELNNAHNASQLLIQWAKLYFNQPILSGLSAAIELIDNDSLGNAINHLESCQYSQNKENWQGNDLSSELKNYLQQKTMEKKAKKNKVPPAFSALNP